MAPKGNNSANNAVMRVRFWYALFLFVIAFFGVRLFYVQIIRYDHYKAAALSDQLKQYTIPSSRGIISVHEGDSTVPIVLNQQLYTLYADPAYVKDPVQDADKVARIVGGSATKYEDAMRTKGSRYAVLSKKLTEAQSNKIRALKLAGIGTQEQNYRIYPQGSLAAHTLGFVNNDGIGTYGIEQALNNELKGTPGQLKAITDVHGVPLATSTSNTMAQPIAGDNVLLTLDLNVQQQVETILKNNVERTKSESGSAIVMDVRNGDIKAMANFPTYNPGNYANVEDANAFNNQAVSRPIEVGSIMKAFTTAAALDSGAISVNQTYYDPAHWMVDSFNITNIEEDGGAGTRSLSDILNLSLNTGATWELMQMGGGGDINRRGREKWYDYMTTHYLLGKETGVEQGYEATGYIPKPANNGAGINLTYANTAFGQAMTATPMQIAGAFSAVMNGGVYYRPHLVDSKTGADGKPVKQQPEILKRGVVSSRVTGEMIPMLQNVVEKHNFDRRFDQSRYIVGGKTGTAQVAKDGVYSNSLFNGTYIGFVGGQDVQYVIVVFMIHPQIGGYAGTAAAQPVFGDIAHMLIDNSYVQPKSL